MQVPLKPLFSVETKCFVGLLNMALWTLNFKQELGSKVSQWSEEMEESTGDPCVTLEESLQCSTFPLGPWFVGEVFTFTGLGQMEPEWIFIFCSRSPELIVCVSSSAGDPSCSWGCALEAEADPCFCPGFVGGFAGRLILPCPDIHFCCFLSSLSPPFLIPGNCGNKGTTAGGWTQFVQAKLHFWKPGWVLGVESVSPGRFAPQTSLCY